MPSQTSRKLCLDRIIGLKRFRINLRFPAVYGREPRHKAIGETAKLKACPLSVPSRFGVAPFYAQDTKRVHLIQAIIPRMQIYPRAVTLKLL